MKLKILSAVVLAASLATGSAAIAQTTDSTSSSDTSRTDPGALEAQRALMGGFYTDDTMTTLRSEDEIRQAWGGMSSADQEQLRTHCVDMQSGRESAEESQAIQDLCGLVETY